MSAGVPIGIGIDTLTAWSTGEAGWRPADLYLRRSYPRVKDSVMAPNGLRGSMITNGLLVARHVRERGRREGVDVVLSEAHPKVLYYASTGRLYDYDGNSVSMDAALSGWLGFEVTTRDSNQWDAFASAYAVLQGIEQLWTRDLHQVASERGETLWHPAGSSHYFWP